MFTHIVFFRLKPEAKDQISVFVQKLSAMSGKIPALKGIEAGADVIHSARSYDVALITRFDDVEGMQAYQVHPVHQEFLQYAGQVVESSAAVDFKD